MSAAPAARSARAAMPSAADQISLLPRARAVRPSPGTLRTASRGAGLTGSTPTAAITRAGFTATGTGTTAQPGDGATRTGAAGAGAGWGLGLRHGSGAGLGLGWGLSIWGFGSALYGMGYMPYNNVYYVDNSVVAAPYDYSQPIDTASAPADESVADPAMALFDAGRQSFHDGDYAGALQKTDQALAKLPNDTTLHEFRASVSLRAGSLRRGRGHALRRALGRPGLGLDDADQPLPERRRLHDAASRSRRLLQEPSRRRPAPGSCSPTTT